jgi:hypothetical protein
MQSFKSYLQEEDPPRIFFDPNYTFYDKNDIHSMRDLIHIQPDYVTGCIIKNDFDISGLKNIKSWDDGPSYIAGTLYAADTGFTTLKGMPKYIGSDINLRMCMGLTTLEGCVQECNGYFAISNCVNLVSLKWMPKKITGILLIRFCHSLRGILSILLCDGIIAIKDEITTNQNNAQLREAMRIVKDHYFNQDRDILECKAELIENGLGEYAKL